MHKLSISRQRKIIHINHFIYFCRLGRSVHWSKKGESVIDLISRRQFKNYLHPGNCKLCKFTVWTSQIKLILIISLELYFSYNEDIIKIINICVFL